MAKVVSKVRLSNGQISVCLRPDAATDKSYDSWHTFTVSPTTTLADAQAWLQARKAEVEAQYSTMTSLDSLLTQL